MPFFALIGITGRLMKEACLVFLKAVTVGGGDSMAFEALSLFFNHDDETRQNCCLDAHSAIIDENEILIPIRE